MSSLLRYAYLVGLVSAMSLAWRAQSNAETLASVLEERGLIENSALSTAAKDSSAKIYWKNGTHFDYVGKNPVTSALALQSVQRYAFSDYNRSSGKEDTSSFDIQEVRPGISGSMLDQGLSYFMQGEFAGKVVALRDAYFTLKPSSSLDFRLGQWVTPFSRQWNTSKWKLQFIDRSIASDFFMLGREAGISSALTSSDSRVCLELGIFNGESDGEAINSAGVDLKHTYLSSFRVTPIGSIAANEEGDFEYTQDLSLSIGGAYAYSEFEKYSKSNLLADNRHAANLDLNIKLKGLSIHSEAYYAHYPEVAGQGSVDPSGFYVQSGYFIVPNAVELAGRYAAVDCDGGVYSSLAYTKLCSGFGHASEEAAVLNYYPEKRNLRFGLVCGVIKQSAIGTADDVELRRYELQVTSYF